jgi:hypothetical protein
MAAVSAYVDTQVKRDVWLSATVSGEAVMWTVGDIGVRC